MLKPLRDHLAHLEWQEGDPPPVVDLDLYFAGNDEETCIAPNAWGDGRPPLAQMHRQFQRIAQRPEVQCVLVGLHPDWQDDSFSEGFPPAEHVHIITRAGKSEVEGWLAGLHADGVVKGWPQGKPAGAPEAGKGCTVYTVCWD